MTEPEQPDQIYAIVRQAVRDELAGGRSDETALINARHMGAAVRAEIARRDVTMADASAAVGVTPPTFAGRVKGHTSFTVEELGAIAELLGITVRDLLDSAELGRRMSGEVPLRANPWEQPARSRARRRNRSVP